MRGVLYIICVYLHVHFCFCFHAPVNPDPNAAPPVSQPAGAGQAQTTAGQQPVNPFAALFGGNVNTPMPASTPGGATAAPQPQAGQFNFLQQLGSIFGQQVQSHNNS